MNAAARGWEASGQYAGFSSSLVARQKVAAECWCRCTQAGLLLAETEFALQVESDIAAFKGLLMGLFFMTVGMEISVGLFFAQSRVVLSAMALLIIGKVRAER